MSGVWCVVFMEEKGRKERGREGRRDGKRKLLVGMAVVEEEEGRKLEQQQEQQRKKRVEGHTRAVLVKSRK